MCSIILSLHVYKQRWANYERTKLRIVKMIIFGSSRDESYYFFAENRIYSILDHLRCIINLTVQAKKGLT